MLARALNRIDAIAFAMDLDGVRISWVPSRSTVLFVEIGRWL